MNHYPELANEKECTGCLACVDSCPKKAISTFINDEGHYAVSVETEECVMCGRCEKICYQSRADYGNNDLNSSVVYAGYTANEELRENATSGGIFAAVAKMVIDKGGAVIGAYFDGKKAKHILIENVSDIYKLQGSKYTPSSMEGIYKTIQDELKKRVVLFTGTGCQVGGVLSFFTNSPYRDNLYTIDLVCGGVPSTALVKLFNDHYQNQYSICTFRNKDKYELTVRNQNNEIRVMSSKALPLGGFSCEMTNRYACYDCKFAFCHRKSDLTIGDVWNYNILPQEHSKGLSLIISNTQKGEQLLKQSELITTKIDWADVLKTNYRIAYGKGRIFSPRKKLQYNLSKLPYEKIEQIYCLSVKPYNFGLFCFKVYRHIVCKIEQRKRQKYIDELLSKML